LPETVTYGQRLLLNHESFPDEILEEYCVFNRVTALVKYAMMLKAAEFSLHTFHVEILSSI